MKFVYADGWSDYYDELPGGEPRGRSLLAELFDTRELGEWEPKLSRYKGFSLPVPTDQFPTLMLVKRTWGGKKTRAGAGRAHAQGQADRPAAGRRRRGDPGPHAADRAARAAADLDRSRRSTNSSSRASDRVAGVVVQRGGRRCACSARDGVLMNVGGFSRNAAMRERFQPQPSSASGPTPIPATPAR